MTARIAWDVEIPAEVRTAIAPHLATHLHRIPGWVHELRVGYDPNNTEAAAWNRTLPEYRWARINVCGNFLSESLVDRDEIILHEIVHIPVQAIVNAAEQLLKLVEAHTPSAGVVDYAREQLRTAMEGTVSDVTRMLTDAIGAPTAAPSVPLLPADPSPAPEPVAGTSAADDRQASA